MSCTVSIRIHNLHVMTWYNVTISVFVQCRFMISGKGDLFGADINMDDPVGISCCDVRSLTYCELQCINIRGFVDVLSLYPDFAEKFQKDIRHDLTYNLKDGYEDEEVYMCFDKYLIAI